ncbi:L,D-transpeptidase family protein [Flammeovirgaceae bacterium SG7u.111]|nr:L,D-transpeptidase family protein [Flammeovirgaceae bacterium SG7u.132]WPO38700.1 L,D-transpeptidase family protein [Flammeovirgaceae bacterium SG7u.111]
MKRLIFFILFFSISILPNIHAQDRMLGQDELVAQMKSVLKAYEKSDSIAVAGTHLFSKKVIPAFYAFREYVPAWTDPNTVAQAIASIKGAYKEGLNPEDYHLSKILKYRSRQNNTAKDAVFLDILLTDGVLLYASHLYNGKVDPVSLDSDWNLEKKRFGADTLNRLDDVIAKGGITEKLDGLKPQTPVYTNLKKQLEHYRVIVDKGGWQQIEDGETLKPGMDDKRVPAVRRRLFVEGFVLDTLMESDVPTTYFDKKLAQGVVKFQQVYGLDLDSAVGKGTLASLNVTAIQRVNQIRVNLERARWVTGNLGNDFLLVNIAGFELFLTKDNKEVWRTEVMVGKPYHKTPVFRGKMSYLVLNPTWTIPSGILANETIPKMRKDPGYLAKNNMVLMDNSGKKYPQSVLTPSQLQKNYLPYQVVQTPGPHNALGRVKFIFPNSHSVYLHDTPSKSLFSRASRAFSHGCIRVKDPLMLAKHLLADDAKWSEEEINKVIAKGDLTNVRLPKPLDVLLLYWTAGVESNGQVYFKEDVYDRDQFILDLLDEKRLVL